MQRSRIHQIGSRMFLCNSTYLKQDCRCVSADAIGSIIQTKLGADSFRFLQQKTVDGVARMYCLRGWSKTRMCCLRSWLDNPNLVPTDTYKASGSEQEVWERKLILDRAGIWTWKIFCLREHPYSLKMWILCRRKMVSKLILLDHSVRFSLGAISKLLLKNHWDTSPLCNSKPI